MTLNEHDVPTEPESTRPASAALAVDVVVTEDVPDASDLRAWLTEQFEAMVLRAGVMQGRICISIVDDAVMAQLHEQYCDEPGTTDVLTFDLREQPDHDLDADLVLCLDEAKRQSASRGHEVRLELLLYAVHGLLHLLGEDDHDPSAAARMHEKEDELLTQAGFGAVYARPARHGDPLR